MRAHQFNNNDKAHHSGVRTEPGTPFFAPVVQPKLTVNQPGDAYEQEADAVADQVMRMPAFVPSADKQADAPVVQRMALSTISNVQRQCAACAAGEQEELQRKETSGGNAGGHAAPAIVNDVLSSGGGQAMDGGTRQFMESRFGQDFGKVRIHTDSRAAESATAIQARAYTSGRDIVFGQGEYQPASESGRRLLAHELVHVGQQGNVNTVKRTDFGWLGGKCRNASSNQEWALLEGIGWFRLAPGDSSPFSSDCEGMTCGGGFYHASGWRAGAFLFQNVCSTPRRDSPMYRERRWTPTYAGREALAPSMRVGIASDTPPDYTYDTVSLP